MTGLGAQLLVLAKEPVPGLVKTRLSPTFSPAEAAKLAEAALVDTLRAVAATEATRRILALEGTPGAWFDGSSYDLLGQRGAGLAERMANALGDTWSSTPLPILLVGMDTPQVTSVMLAHALTTLLEPDVDAVLGPADDGGYWSIGLREPRAELILGVEMSTARTGSAQLVRLRAAGLRVRLLPGLRDVDTAADAAAVSAEAPHTSFAKTWSALVAERGRQGSEDAA